MHRIIGFVLFFGLGACASASKPGSRAEWDRIVALEDARAGDATEWAELASSPEAMVRERVAVALGRILDPALLSKLVPLACDANLPVRRKALWALGQYGWLLPPCDREKELVNVVRTMLTDREETVRAAAVEAIGKLATVDAPVLAAPFLRDPSPSVRAEAALACFRWQRVLRMRGHEGELPPFPSQVLEGLMALAADEDPEVRWRVAFVLRDVRAISVLLQLSRDPCVWARLYAVRNIKILHAAERAFTESIDEDVHVLAEAQGDEEYTIRVEAIQALTEFHRTDLIRATLVQDKSVHVRIALANSARPDLLTALEADPSASVRAAVVKGWARALKEGAKERLAVALANRDWRVRKAAVEGAMLLGRDGLSLLEVARDDAHELVRAAVVTAVGSVEGRWVMELLRGALESEGLPERGTAVEVLEGRTEPEALQLAMRTYELSLNSRWVEVRETIVDVVGGKNGPEEWLRWVLTCDPSAAVRRKAASALTRRGVPKVAVPKVSPLPAPFVIESFDRNPHVVLETTRGRIVMECYPREAPQHVANFVGLVRQGFYDGLMWHRVEPNFVIQGGDPLGNGWGDGGFQVRAEINELRYARGSVGMPRAADFDTGGCQIFITHIPTPSLDGLYTIYGRVIEGLEVVDAIEGGDQIIKASVQ